MSIKEDIEKYPCFLYRHKTLLKIPKPETWNNSMQMHHFVRQSIRKNSPDFYSRVEHLQKLILMPSQMNYDLETMGEIKFFQRYGVNKNDLVFNRKKWREGYYERERAGLTCGQQDKQCDTLFMLLEQEHK